jgi:hypothetical protein
MLLSMPIPSSIFLFFNSSFKFLGLILNLWSILNWFLHRVREGSLVSVFLMWTSSFPYTICWRGCFFQCMFLACLSKNKMTVAMWIYFWVFYSIPLVYVSVFLPIPCYCFCFFLNYDCSIWSQVLWYLQHCSFYSGLFWYASIWSIRLTFIFLRRMTLGFWWELHWIYRLLSVV